MKITVETEKTKRMWETISKECDTCILSFSRGKDSIATWIICSQYFKRVIPFHLVCVPRLGWVERSLDYYEQIFDTKILRLLNGESHKALACLWFQPWWREEEIEKLTNLQYFNHWKVPRLIRKEYGCPNAWFATGERIDDNESGSLLKKHDGIYRMRNRRKFHPVFDWTDDKVMQLIEDNGIDLPVDYLFAHNTLHDMPTARHLYGIRDMFPEDYEIIKKWFPYIELQIIRNEMRKAQFAKKGVYVKEQGTTQKSLFND